MTPPDPSTDALRLAEALELAEIITNRDELRFEPKETETKLARALLALNAEIAALRENQRTAGSQEICRGHDKDRCGRSVEFVKRHNSCTWEDSRCPIRRASHGGG